MKEFFKILCSSILCCLCLSGCFWSNSKANEEIVKNQIVENSGQGFTSSCDFKYKDIEGELEFSKETAENFSLKFLSPKEVKDLKINSDNDTVIFEFKGIKKEIKKDEIYSSAFVKLIANCLNSISNDNAINVSINNDKILVEGNSDKSNFLLELNRDNMDILSLCFPEDDIKIVFKNFDLI